MKKQGFTLVELMGVLIIIGILSLIIIPVISNVIKEQKETQYEQQKVNIEMAAKNYVSDHLRNFPTTGGEYTYITIGQLKTSGYLVDSIINPITDKEISNCTQIKITRLENNYDYEYLKDTESITEC